MSDLHNTTPLDQPNISAERLAAFRVAVQAFSEARTELASLGAMIAMQGAAPDDIQRNRLQQMSTKHFMAGETVKAMAMTLMSNGLLERCVSALERDIQ